MAVPTRDVAEWADRAAVGWRGGRVAGWWASLDHALLASGWTRGLDFSKGPAATGQVPGRVLIFLKDQPLARCLALFFFQDQGLSFYVTSCTMPPLIILGCHLCVILCQKNYKHI